MRRSTLKSWSCASTTAASHPPQAATSMSAPSSSGRECRWCWSRMAGRSSPTSAFTIAVGRRGARASSSRSTMRIRVHNSAVMSTRGEHLVRADRRFATGGGTLARLISPAFARILDQIDRRLVSGGFELTLPEGTTRRIGFRAPGPNAVVHILSWLALVRLATSGSVGWYKAWTLGEWSSPDPVSIFELFSANAVALGNVGRAKGPFRLVNALAHRLRDNAPRKARKNIAAHYDLGNDFYAAWLDETMTYSSARFANPGDALEDGQIHKIRTLLDRLEIKPGHRLLEIGCGWGTLAIEAA